MMTDSFTFGNRQRFVDEVSVKARDARRDEHVREAGWWAVHDHGDAANGGMFPSDS